MSGAYIAVFVLIYINTSVGSSMPLNPCVRNKEGFSSIGGVQQFIFDVLSGVLQGCPLSGCLLVICMDPLLKLFVEYGQKPFRSQLRACADDVGAALRKLKQLHILHQLFSEMQKASGLILKPAKCVIVLLTFEANSAVTFTIKESLLHYVPDRANFQIANIAKYLGFFLGPDAGTKQWDGPCQRFRDRVSDIQDAKLLVQFSSIEFSSKAMPVLLYVGQPVPIPSNSRALEVQSVSELMRLATNSLSFDCMLNLSELGGVDFRRPFLSVQASTVRAAVQHFVIVVAWASNSLLRLKGASLLHTLRKVYIRTLSCLGGTPPLSAYMFTGPAWDYVSRVVILPPPLKHFP